MTLARKALGEMGMRALPYLVEALNDKDSQVRQSAATFIGYLGKEAHSAIPDLIKALRIRAQEFAVMQHRHWVTTVGSLVKGDHLSEMQNLKPVPLK